MIRLKKVEKTFGSWHFGPVDFAAGKNETVAILGKSGSGKTTLLHFLGGYVKPDAGEIFFDKENILAMSDKELSQFRNQNIGFVFQEFFLLPRFTAKENIMMKLLIGGRSKVEAEKIAMAKLKELGLDDKANLLPKEMSGGQRQRVAIARAVAGSPRVILADEPTGNLDKETGQDIIDLLWRLQKTSQCSMIIVTHDQKIADKADKILQIKNGQIV